MSRNAWLPFLSALLAWACTAAAAQAGPPTAPATGPPGGMPEARREARVPLEHLPALAGDYFHVDSAHTGRRYHVYVRLPEGYHADPERRWPVVYLLDGDSLFPLLAPTHLFLHYDEHLPEAIVVGIAYGSFDPAVNRRHVDFSAPGPETPDEGGASAFLACLERELLPATERRHRIDPSRRILVGQSLGGYFVLWSALQRPDLFRGRIASNPAFSRTRANLVTGPGAHVRDDLAVVVVSGARDHVVRMQDAETWTGAWRSRADRPWALHHLVLPQGTHAASIGEAYRRAMPYLLPADVAAPAAPAAVASPGH